VGRSRSREPAGRDAAEVLWHTHDKFSNPSPPLSHPDDGNPTQDKNAESSPFVRADSSFDDQREKQARNAGNPSQQARGLFQPGSILVSRFRILRMLGRGGMGEVYEAEDLVLKENVALKTLLPQIATDEHFRARFRREVLLARKVTHPNVCRIFDVFGDTPEPEHGGDVKSVDVPFMSMELLRGNTLAQALAVDGQTAGSDGKGKRYSPQEALPIVTQMAAALDAAHQAGVVHRDFKTSNVFLAGRPGASAPRVVVTDFGLARMSEAEGAGGVSFTGQNEFVGTPLYMAPEQVEGGEITPATDIYALGVVLYEMMTGAWPFLGKTPRETANLRLKATPASPKSLVSSLDEKWNAVILRCLERNPGDRFRSIREVVESLEGETVALRRRTRAQRERLQRALQVAAGIAAALVAAFATYHWWPRGVTTGNHTSVAVVRLQSLSPGPEKNWIGTSLEETLTRELAASDGLRVIPTGDVARMRQELVLPATGEIEGAKLGRIQGNLGVDDLILGDYELSGQPSDEQIRVTLRIFDPSRGAEPTTITENGRESDLFGLSDLVARNVRAALKIRDISAADRARLRAAFPESNASSRAYYDGLEKLRQFDPLGALDYLKDAVQGSPGAPLPHVALSEAWNILGYDQQALAEAERAQQTSARLSKPEQREIVCRVLELQRSDWESAISACRGVWELRKRLGDGLRLADVQFSAERWNASLATLALLRKELPVPENDDPRIDNAEARTREALTQYAEMETAAQSAVDKAKKQGAKMFEAQALLWSCVARQNLDKLEAAKQDCTTANDIYATVGDKIGQARTLTSLGHALGKLHDAAADKKYEEALSLATAVGSVRDRCDALINFGGVFYDEGKLDAAVPKYKASLAIGEQSGNLGCQARAVENLGSIARDRRDFGTARANFDRASQLYTGLNMIFDLARLQSNFGDLLWKQGEPAEALLKLQDATRRYREVGARDGLGMALVQLGDVLLAGDEGDKALAAYREAVQIKKELHEDDEAGITDISIAQTLVEGGGAADAEPMLRKVVAWCGEKKDFNNEVFARDVLVRSLLAQSKKNHDAVTEARTLQAALPKANDQEAILSARITIARAFATQQPFPQALADLRAIAEDARKQRFTMQELSAKLALLESARLQGTKSDASSLQAFVQSAKSRGYLLLARKASALLVASS
jgi:serine/threonine protein kinase/tetratricopeptide (TPR) repeat protein